MEQQPRVPRRPGDVRGGAGAPVPPAQPQRHESRVPPRTHRDTGGVEVRIGSRSERHRRPERRPNRRGWLAAGLTAATIAGVFAVGGLLLLPGSDDEPAAPGDVAAAAPGGDENLPHAGRAVTVATADGARYRVAAVTGGADEGAAAQQAGVTGGKAVYIEYVLGNPTKEQVLLDYPGDVFVRKDLLRAGDRGRCMWQAGVPEDMCTPPAKNEVVRRLAGGALIQGDGEDRYMPPGSSYLVRSTVELPVSGAVKRSDLRLYIWKKLYVDDQYARQAPFPN
ncbi:hypothetical protein [Actinomadura flavalba]|uniref:hypothetical protein n=1 Tax=Actinomadura flavalba TaxID=1120938 RepID=UPI00037CD13E|nr:hypothetical protein [Actinomadura flavalba]